MQNSTLLRLGRALLAPLALVAVASASAAYAAPAVQAAPISDQTVSIDSFAFAPGDVSLPVGATLVWSNIQTGVPHTATSVDGIWDSGVLSSGATFSFTFNQLGDFAYQCEIHPTMHGIVHVVGDAIRQTDAAAAMDSTTDPAATADVAPLASTATVTVTSTAQQLAPTATPTPVATRPASTPAPNYYGY